MRTPQVVRRMLGVTIAFALLANTVAGSGSILANSPANPSAKDASRSDGARPNAACINDLHYHKVLQWTSITAGFFHPPTSCQRITDNFQYAFDGIFSYIGRPATAISLKGPAKTQHVAAWVNVSFSLGTWMQTGWTQGWVGELSCTPNDGTHHCINPSSPHIYIEINDVGFYSIEDLGPMPTSGFYFKVTRDSEGCWTATAVGLAARQRCGLYDTGETMVGFEVYDANLSSQIVVPSFDFGGPYSNTAVQLHYQGKWEFWDTALSGAGQTGRYDERYSAPMCTKISHYLIWYKFLALSKGNTAGKTC